MKRKRKRQLWEEKMVMMGKAVRIMVRKDTMVKKKEIMVMREIMEKTMVRRAKGIRVKKNKKEKGKKDKGRRERKNRMGDQVNPQEINQLNNKPVKV
jgi:hypothetical protein